jgi:hypothetical protein
MPCMRTTPSRRDCCEHSSSQIGFVFAYSVLSPGVRRRRGQSDDGARRRSIDPYRYKTSTRSKRRIPIDPRCPTIRLEQTGTSVQTVEHHRGHADDRRGGGNCEFYRPAVWARVVCLWLACPDLQKTGVVRATVRMPGEPEKEGSRASGSKRRNFGTVLSHLGRPGGHPERGLSRMAEVRSLERKP